MQPLRKRLRPDNIPNEKRVERGRTGRTIYLLLLGLFCIAVANYLLGDYFLLNADGLVLRDQHVVATTYVARVETVEVREGQEVKEGAALLKLQSTDILERLAELSTKQADIIAKITDFKVRAESVTQLLPLAERREAEATQAIRQFDTLLEGKYVTSVRYEEALRANYEASRERVTLFTQGNVLKEELTSLDRARDDADDALSKLQAIYADGLVHSPVNGSIGTTIPSVGTVYRPGDPILSIYSGQPYVLVYLPRRYLFTIRTGMDVRITDGREVADGVVTEILPLTDTLPKEFQNTFKPSDRNQLAKITIAAPSLFPLNQTVRVSRHMPLGGLVEIRKLLGLSDSQAATRAP
jgi:multidrug resistance efflux pump